MTEWKCVCAGQGGEVYSSECPVHDPHVDTSSPTWREWYFRHLSSQAHIKRTLGWE